MPERATPKKPAPRATAKEATATDRTDAETSEAQEAGKAQAPTAVQPVEPEDAYLTGVSRSLQRRLLGLNVEGAQGQARPRPEATEAGLHSTGSNTGATAEANPKSKASKKK